MVLVFGPPDQVRDHLLKALPNHCIWLRTNGYAIPPWLNRLIEELAATDGQTRTSGPSVAAEAHTDHVPVLLDYAAVAARLCVSERTVRRLTSTGKLPAVEVAGCKRVRVTDLAAYVKGL